MKKEYTNPELELIIFEVEDVITTSVNDPWNDLGKDPDGSLNL